MIEYHHFFNRDFIGFETMISSLKKEDHEFFIVVSLANCEACENLVIALRNLAATEGKQASHVVVGFTVMTMRDLYRLKLRVESFPTLLKYRGEQILDGWAGMPVLNDSESTYSVLRKIFLFEKDEGNETFVA